MDKMNMCPKWSKMDNCPELDKTDKCDEIHNRQIFKMNKMKNCAYSMLHTLS